VIEVEFVFGRVAVANAFLTTVLELLDEVLVRDLSKTTTLLSVEVDVVNIERGIIKFEVFATGLEGVTGNVNLISRAESDVDADLVILEGNKGEGQTVIASEVELERNVESVRGLEEIVIRNIPAESADGGEFGDVTNHLSITSLVADLARELVPDVKPITVLLVDLRATNFELSLVNNSMSDTSDPSESNVTELGEVTAEANLWENDLEEGLCNKITITGDLRCGFTTKIGGSTEILFN
jgi:hypothetical protein